jgi:hypothetical protein
MWKPRCLSLLAAFVSLLLVVSSSRGQGTVDYIVTAPDSTVTGPRQSHIVIEGGTSADAEDLLRSRLQLAQKNSELEKLAADVIKDPGKYGLKPDDLRKLAERHAGSGKPPPSGLDPANPEVKKAIEEAQQALRRRQPTVPDARREETRLGDELRNIANRPLDSRLPPQNSGQTPVPTPPPGMTPNPPPGNTIPPQRPGGPTPTLRPAQSSNSSAAANNSRWMRSFTDALGNSPLTDSDSLRSFVSSLSENQRAGAPARDDRKSEDNTWDNSLSRLGRHLPDKVDMPDTTWSTPRADIRTPSAGAGADTGGEGLAMAALIIVIAALSVFAAWGLWRFGPPTRWRRAGSNEALGPWPVSPHAVHTRAELIRAFEYLAVLLLGRSARTLNHLDIAAGLVIREPDRRDAADRLAHAYEQARYAPPDEPLPEEELLAARRDLCLLAGAAAV